MILPKVKKIFLLILLVIVSFALSAVKLISGTKGTSQAQAQCWTPSSSSSGCSTGGWPDACVSVGTSGTSGTSSSTGCGCVGCA